MIRFYLRFYAELNDFLPRNKKQSNFEVDFPAQTSIKHAIESIGVPHTEVDLILVNGASTDFSYLPQEGDRVSIYPVFESLDIFPVIKLRPEPLRDPIFVLDAHLGKLARYLRMFGFDTSYRNNFSDEELAGCSNSEHRILLTRDVGLLKRSFVSHAYYIRETDPKKQLVETILHFDLTRLAQPFQRCLECNQTLEKVDKVAVLNRLQTNTARYYDEFNLCPVCDKVYWKGPHYRRMASFIQEIQALVSSGTNLNVSHEK